MAEHPLQHTNLYWWTVSFMIPGVMVGNALHGSVTPNVLFTKQLQEDLKACAGCPPEAVLLACSFIGYGTPEEMNREPTGTPQGQEPTVYH